MDDTHIPIRSRFTYTVIGTDTDVLDRLTPHALFGFKQEAATVHAHQLGMSPYVEAKNGAWLLRRSRARWFRRPRFRDDVTVETWSRGVSLVTFLRDFTFYINGDFAHPAGIGSSEWIIADKATHKPLRPFDVIPANLINTRCDPAFAIDAKSPRLAEPAEAPAYMQRREIGYAELDHNHHVNNTFYLRYGIDAVALALHRRNRLDAARLDFADMDVAYLRELSFGDRLELYAAEQEGAWYVEGIRNEAERCFRMTLRPFA